MKFDEVMLFYKRFLRAVGILPFDGRDYNFLGTYLWLGFFIMSSIANSNMYIFYGINAESFGIDYVYEVVIVFGIHIRYYTLLSKRRDFKELVDECESIWNECNDREHQVIFIFERKIRRLFIYILLSCNLVGIFYAISAININRHAVWINGTDPRVLPAKWYFGDRVDAWPGYKITFCLQCIIISIAGLEAAIVDVSIPLLIMFSSGYFSTLRQRLDDLHQSTDCKHFERNILAATVFHQKLLDFSSKTEQIGRMILLCQLMCSGYNTALIGIKIAGSDPQRFQFLPELCLSLGELLICQYAPDYLFDESEAVAISAYSTANTLVEFESDFGKHLVLMILRANRPVQITAGGLVNLSMGNFVQVLKTTFSFFMVLRSLNM